MSPPNLPLKETIDAAHDEGAFLSLAMAAASLAVLSACAPLGPDYQRPRPSPNVTSERAALDGPLAQYKEAAKLLKPATSDPAATAGAPTSDWWRAFADPGLDALMSEVAAGNQNIAQAEARYRQALASLQQSQARQWPTLGSNASATRSSQGGAAGRSTATALTTSLAASGELDCGGESGGELRPECQRCRQRRRSGSHHAQLARSSSPPTMAACVRWTPSETLLEDAVEAYERS